MMCTIRSIHPPDPSYRVTRPFLITVAWVLKAGRSNSTDEREVAEEKKLECGTIAVVDESTLLLVVSSVDYVLHGGYFRHSVDGSTRLKCEGGIECAGPLCAKYPPPQFSGSSARR